MIVQPKIRGFICTTAHPVGCARNVQEQIDYVRRQGLISGGPKKVLVVGSSTGYGLASRIVSSFCCGAATIGVFYERAAEPKRTATAGWYNSVAFERAAQAAGLYARSLNGDAFSGELKQQVVDLIRRDWGGEVDLVIYSLAAPRRVHQKTGQLCKSVLKPCGQTYTNKSLDLDTNEVVTVTLPAATEEEITQTVTVMGGEDWQLWIDALDTAGLIREKFMTVAYSYVGPEVTRPVYRNGTIGAAKNHLEATARELDQKLQARHGRAFVSVNKALVTQSSAAIPFIPLYYVLLMRVLKEKGLHEDCVQQIYRLFKERLYCRPLGPVDAAGRIRVDDYEMRDDVQQEVQKLWAQVDNGNIHQIADVCGFQEDFLRLFGFGLSGVDYNADVDIDLSLAKTS